MFSNVFVESLVPRLVFRWKRVSQVHLWEQVIHDFEIKCMTKYSFLSYLYWPKVGRTRCSQNQEQIQIMFSVSGDCEPFLFQQLLCLLDVVFVSHAAFLRYSALASAQTWMIVAWSASLGSVMALAQLGQKISRFADSFT